MVYHHRAICMRDLRAALVAVPPLLTDLIRYALMSRVPITVICELADVRDLEWLVGEIDVVLLGSPGQLETAKAAATLEILVLSDDFRELRWPATGRSMPLSVQNLIGTLERIADDLDLRSQSNPDP